MTLDDISNDMPTEKMDPWFVTWDFGGKSIDAIRKHAEEMELKAGSTIFAEGDSSDAMYFVLEGMVLVLTKDEKGKEQTVSIITEGQSFGEIGLLCRQSRLATTAAGLDVKLLKVTLETLERLEKEEPSTIIQIYKVLAQTLAEQWMTARHLHQEDQST
ncbi:MAG: cyclic nucleotide-binding domain-containing protein [Chloroflexi bacterium]|nr:cyclic nucleotide-binding domain-containing protein [Chloroflexota bacterium]